MFVCVLVIGVWCLFVFVDMVGVVARLLVFVFVFVFVVSISVWCLVFCCFCGLCC